MSKFYGKIGFSKTEQTSPGVWTERIVRKTYKGDVIKNYARWDGNSYINDDLNISNSISIIADSYIYENAGAIRFIEWMGSLWKISSIEVQRPRLILSIGGLYNGPEETNDSDNVEEIGTSSEID